MNHSCLHNQEASSQNHCQETLSRIQACPLEEKKLFIDNKCNCHKGDKKYILSALSMPLQVFIDPHHMTKPHHHCHPCPLHLKHSIYIVIVRIMFLASCDKFGNLLVQTKWHHWKMKFAYWSCFSCYVHTQACEHK